MCERAIAPKLPASAMLITSRRVSLTPMRTIATREVRTGADGDEMAEFAARSRAAVSAGSDSTTVDRSSNDGATFATSDIAWTCATGSDGISMRGYMTPPMGA